MKRKAKKASAHTCSILKRKISTARTMKARGHALGKFAKARCAKRRKRRS